MENGACFATDFSFTAERNGSWKSSLEEGQCAAGYNDAYISVRPAALNAEKPRLNHFEVKCNDPPLCSKGGVLRLHVWDKPRRSEVTPNWHAYANSPGSEVAFDFLILAPSHMILDHAQELCAVLILESNVNLENVTI